MKKTIIYLLMLALLCNFVSADYFDSGTILFPDSMNWTFTFTKNVTFTNIVINETCIKITGGTYAGTYCFNLTTIYAEDILLFPGTPISCFIEVDLNSITYPLNYFWYNSTSAELKTGSQTCEDETVCLVDTLEGTLVPEPGDTVQCNATITGDFFEFKAGSNIVNVHDAGTCSASRPYPILNITFYDEAALHNETNDWIKINVTNTWNLSFNNGFGAVVRDGTFTGNNSYLWCSDVNPAIDHLTMDIYGLMEVSNTDYVTRVFNIPQIKSFAGNNNPVSEINLTLIKVANSTTITYAWQTTEFQAIDGIMQIYRCEANGSRTLIESTLISSGEAYANIELLTTAYSYQIIVDGELFTDDEFTTCHTESTTSREFYVDTTRLDLLPVIGLMFVDCSLTRVSDNVVRMAWSINNEDTDPIEACMIALRRIGTDFTEIYQNCSTASNGSITRSIPDSGNDYIVRGEITQNGQTLPCQNQISFYDSTDAASKLDILGLLAVFILVGSLYLSFADYGENMQIAGAIGIVLGFVLGILKLSWYVFSLLLAFIAIIVVVMRYTKHREVE